MATGLHRAQAYTVCTTQIENNRYERVVTALGVGPQQYRQN